MLVATAGHIDHGKTSLVRAITGVETDRLPEERARGISIDLGFAYWRPEGVATVGFVDVPGHERFVRNMLAGVSAVDAALVVVAADDGVMPQTVEHVDILDLLGVGRGFVALTKCDRVPAGRVAEVGDQIHALLARTGLAGSAIFEVSSVTGAGIAALAEALRMAAMQPPARSAAGRNFRLAIDRAFTLTGVGTVVTGTVLDGAVEPGATLVVAPAGREVRVRGLHSAGKPVTRVEAGERSALSLAGVELSQLRRGDWLLEPAMNAPTSRIEVLLRLLPGRADPLRHNTPVHLHIGTADIEARILIRRQEPIAPGNEAVASLVLDADICAATGDRFVIRDHAGRQTLGGGRVTDPFASASRRGRAERLAVSAAFQAAGPAEALAALLAIPGYEVDAHSFERRFNLQPAAAAQLYRQADAVTLSGGNARLAPASRLEALGGEIVAALSAFHRDSPQAPGMPAADAAAALSMKVSADTFQSIRRMLIEQRRIESGGSHLRLAGHRAAVNNADVELWARLLAAAGTRPESPFTIAEMAAELHTGEETILGLIVRMRGTGDVWRITAERFMLNRQVALLAGKAAALAAGLGGAGFTAAQYRDVIGTGRGLAIQILEFFDLIGVTRRHGDLRRVQPEHDRILKRAAQLERGKPAVSYMPKGRPGARKAQPGGRRR
jgi:selenocysteine-specific elongation factor